ncbi:RhoGEF and PH domain-containing protein FGD [Acrasis kona]|uniref:RhoGEF and PH domain-containing protein FGD n=1 Tax=Acrasis kona TaxID=1008807 RepID=A0AAW2Z5W9_9EUKA
MPISQPHDDTPDVQEPVQLEAANVEEVNNQVTNTEEVNPVPEANNETVNTEPTTVENTQQVIDPQPVDENSIDSLQEEDDSQLAELANDEEETARKKAEKEQQELQEKKLKREKTRNHVMREILSTEQTYVDWLKVLDNEFMKPLKQSIEKGNDPLIALNEYQNMFMDIEVVVRVNQELLKSLKDFFRHNGILKDGQEPDENSKYLSLGDIFLKMTPFLRSYTSYINRYEGIFKFIEEKRDSKKKFKKWLDKTQGQPATLHQQLFDFMILPRIPRYNLLLRELVANMDEEDSDYKKIVQANNDIKDVAQRVNERLREQNAQERLVVLGENILGLSFELLRASRKFLYEGVVGYVSHTGIKLRSLFLFSDLLLSAAPIQAPSSPIEEAQVNFEEDSEEANPENQEPQTFPINQKYRMKSAISFLSTPLIWVNDLADGFVLHNAFQIVSKTKVWTYFARNAEEKKEWVAKINKSIELLHHVPSLQGASNSELLQPHPTRSRIAQYLTPKALELMKPYSEDDQQCSPAAPSQRHSSPTLAVNGIDKDISNLRRSSVEKRNSTNSENSSLQKLLTKLQNKQKKKVELDQLTGTIESDDEDETGYNTIKPWMDECNQRLADKKRHAQLVDILVQEKNRLNTETSEYEQDEEYTFVTNPMYGLKTHIMSQQQVGGSSSSSSSGNPATTNYVYSNKRLSIDQELKKVYEKLNPDAEYQAFVGQLRGTNLGGTLVSTGSPAGSGSPESTIQKRKSRFFFL